VGEHIRAQPGFDENLASELSWVRSTHEAVRSGAPSYAELLSNPEPIIRAAAAYLLGIFAEDATRNIDWLRQHLSRGEDDQMARAATVLSIGMMASSHEEVAPWLEQVVVADEPDAVRVADALGTAWAKRSALPVVARSLLVRTAATPGGAAEVFKRFPWGEADIQSYCSSALAIIGGEPARSLPAMMRSLDDVAPFQSWGVARAMLHLAFNGRPKPAGATVHDLTDDQRMALIAIARSKTFWTGFRKDVFIVKPMEVLQAFALPDKPNELRAFLGLPAQAPFNSKSLRATLFSKLSALVSNFSPSKRSRS
jgi:hypothetical protein